MQQKCCTECKIILGWLHCNKKGLSMTPHEAVKKLLKTRYTVREIAALLTSAGVQVSYSTISRINTKAEYAPSKAVARRLVKLAERA
jgi:transposase-like protein